MPVPVIPQVGNSAREPPVGKPTGDLVDEMHLDMDNTAEVAGFDAPCQLAQRQVEPLVAADPQHETGRLAGCDRAGGLGPHQTERLFAKDRFADLRRGDYFAAMQRIRRCDTTASMLGATMWFRNCRRERDHRCASATPRCLSALRDHTCKAQPIALALSRFDEGPAPPAKTDNSASSIGRPDRPGS
jgi:hypothetical protein